MAICKFGTTVVGVSGTIGGLTYSRNSSGPFARLWSRGSNPKTKRQAVTRGRIAGLGTMWAALGDALRGDWQYFAEHAPEIDTNALGEVITLSGWMWFVRVNQRLQSAGLAPVTAVPSDVAVEPLTETTLYVGPGPWLPVVFGWPEGEVPTGYNLVIEMAVHGTHGLVAKTSGFHQILVWAGPDEGPLQLQVLFWEVFGYAWHGWKVFSRAYRLRDDGIRSPACVANWDVVLEE